MISFDSWRTPLQLIDNKLQLDVNGLKVALIKKGLRRRYFFSLSTPCSLKVALIKKGLRRWFSINCNCNPKFESSPD